MSHLVTIKTEIRDRAAVLAAALRLKLPVPVEGKHSVYQDDGDYREVQGMAVRFHQWHAAICELQTGAVFLDEDYADSLKPFKQAYAVEKAKIEARRAGHLVSETTMADGRIKLTLNVMGA